MRKLSILLAFAVLFLAGCSSRDDYTQPERDFLNMIDAVQPRISNGSFDKTLLDRGWAACRMLATGVTFDEISSQVPEDLESEEWSAQIRWAQTFFCPETLRK